MKVNRTEKVERLDGLSRPTKKEQKRESASTGVEPKDALEISTAQLDLKKLQQETEKIFGVRPQTVEQLRSEVNAGTYQLRPEEIAEKMIDEMLESAEVKDD